MIHLNFQELFRMTVQFLRTKHCITLHNPSQSASFSCMIIVFSFTPKNFRFSSASGSYQYNITFLHFCALHCPYCLHLPISVSCTALCYTIFKHHLASLPESAWLQYPWQINALQQSCSLVPQQNTSPEKGLSFPPVWCLKYICTWK